MGVWRVDLGWGWGCVRLRGGAERAVGGVEPAGPAGRPGVLLGLSWAVQVPCRRAASATRPGGTAWASDPVSLASGRTQRRRFFGHCERRAGQLRY